MSNLLNIGLLKRQRLTSLLGLALDGSRLDGVVLRRNNGSLQVQQSFSVSLSLDPLTADAELVGREIRNHLDAAGVRERHCVLGLPLKLALATHAELPDLPEADVASFLQIEAERGFPCDAATLLVASSSCRTPSGKQHAMLVGIPRNHLVVLDSALRAARLKPVSFSLGIVALQPAGPEASGGVLALTIGESHVGLQVTSGGGVAALRTLEGALEMEGGRRLLHADLVARESRITLGQLPAELRESVRRIRIFGPPDLSQQLADEMELRLEPMGLKVELVSRYADNEFSLRCPADAAVSPALSLAAERLAGREALFEFLLPRVTAWQQVTARYSSGKLRTAGAVAAVVFLLVAGLFLIQQWQLMRLQSQWAAIAPRVKELEKITQDIHQFRPWFDDSVRVLSILRQLTQAFPEDGVVSAKTVEIRDLSAVTCTGVTRDNQSLIKTVERLRASGGIADLRVSTIRGKSPMQFTFDYHWSEGGKSEN
ncbi:MAG: hypothetical protein NTX51_00635 [Verrucomicrobia bacterium]|nr:hypothetical protein [Verrucomicrobiota bacterium]